MAVFSDFGLYFISCVGKMTLKPMFMFMTSYISSRKLQSTGDAYVHKMGKKPPERVPSFVPRPIPSFTLYFLLPPLSKIFTFCPMLKALLHLLFRCCVLKRVVSRWSHIWTANAYFMEWFICCCVSPHFFWPLFYCREREMFLISTARTKTFFSRLNTCCSLLAYHGLVLCTMKMYHRWNPNCPCSASVSSDFRNVGFFKSELPVAEGCSFPFSFF